MAHFCIKSHAELGPHTVLAPERYDPRRSLRHRVESATVPLQEVVTFQRTLMLPKQAAQSQGLFQVLDTSDAKSGLIQGPGHQLRGDELGSAKKTHPHRPGPDLALAALPTSGGVCRRWNPQK